MSKGTLIKNAQIALKALSDEGLFDLETYEPILDKDGYGRYASGRTEPQIARAYGIPPTALKGTRDIYKIKLIKSSSSDGKLTNGQKIDVLSNILSLFMISLMTHRDFQLGNSPELRKWAYAQQKRKDEDAKKESTS